jgi:cytochrome d ubiquinol oxidase subunit II
VERLWYWLVVVLLSMYAVLDGFDFGVGCLHLHVARTDSERKTVLSVIGPYWDGNEVWLLAAGGALMLSFPPVIAAGFSGFYLAMYMVVWTLTLRGIAVEFRSHVKDSVWRAFWDTVFMVSSGVMPLLLGIALGNVVRGVPLDDTGYFNIPLFTNFETHNPVGVIDWYTLLMGVFVLSTLVGHGVMMLAWKTDGNVHERVRRLALPTWIVTCALTGVCTVATHRVNESLYLQLPYSPLAWCLGGVGVAGLAGVFLGLRRRNYRMAFIASAGFIAGILGVTAACMFPVMLRSTLNSQYSLTAYNSGSGRHGLLAGMLWMALGVPIALGYVVFLFRVHRGKSHSDGHGY